jgi:site-specific recombinase XerD
MKEKMEKDFYRILELYTEILKIQKRSPEIISAYRAEVRRYFYWLAQCGDLPSSSRQVTTQNIKAYLNDQKQSDPLVACNHTLTVLRSFFAFWYGIDGPENNPTRMIPNLKDAQKTNSWLDRDQQRQLEGAIDQQLQEPVFMVAWSVSWVRSAVLVRFLLHTGLHSVEVRALRLGDIRMGDSHGMVQVRGRRERRVPLDGPTCAALRLWLTIRSDGEHDWLWLERDRDEARLLSERAIWRACRRMVQLTELDPESVSPRILRNTCAHNLLAAGESPRVVGRLLKVSSTKMVLRYL